MEEEIVIGRAFLSFNSVFDVSVVGEGRSITKDETEELEEFPSYRKLRDRCETAFMENSVTAVPVSLYKEFLIPLRQELDAANAEDNSLGRWIVRESIKAERDHGPFAAIYLPGSWQ